MKKYKSIISIGTAAIFLSGCISTMKLNDRIYGNYRNKDGSIGVPQPYLVMLLPLTIVFDIATSPIQAIWLSSEL